MTTFPSACAVKIENLAKRFKIYARPKDILLEVLGRRIRHSEVWPLKNINLEISRGEVLGIVGRNGAGKSTLLKIIAGTLAPTSGSISIDGQVTAILELGSGFHPEYSGRENILMGGMCLGMSRKEIESKSDSIIEFAELGEFIDQPFRTYSSGMQARLTFATAVSVEPDILIIDEALSVGDAKFQQKSFSRIRDFRNAGKTIILVSHDMNAITSFCDKAVILENGSLVECGSPKVIAESYHHRMFGGSGSNNAERITPSGQLSAAETLDEASRYGDKACEIRSYGVTNSEGLQTTVLTTGESFIFEMLLDFRERMEDPSAGVVIRDRRGMDVFGVTTTSINQRIGQREAGESVNVRFEMQMNLAAGDYFVTFGVAHGQGDKADFFESAIQLKVKGANVIFTSSIVDLFPRLTIQVND